MKDATKDTRNAGPNDGGLAGETGCCCDLNCNQTATATKAAIETSGAREWSRERHCWGSRWGLEQKGLGRVLAGPVVSLYSVAEGVAFASQATLIPL